MTDREKVVDRIHKAIDVGVCVDLFMDILSLLKEQAPMQVVRKQIKRENSDGSIDYFVEWYCPHCNSLILRGFDNTSIKFCYKCGKPILWEGR